jgi:hypothetical protein
VATNEEDRQSHHTRHGSRYDELKARNFESATSMNSRRETLTGGSMAFEAEMGIAFWRMRSASQHSA